MGRSIGSISILMLIGLVVFAQTDGGVNSQVDKVFSVFDKPESPGCALAVIRDGQIVYKRGYGMADLDHDVPITPTSVFHVASLSKQFTAMAIELLVLQEKLSLDDEVQKYVPELRGINSRITLRHLIHHTSGLRDQWNLLIMSGWRLSEDVVKEQDVLDLVARMKELNFQPGEQYVYCNTGYTLLGIVVKRVSGLSLREFAEANIFKPLGMSRTFFRDDHSVTVKNQAYAYQGGPNNSFKLSVPNYDTVGASSLLTTVEDLARWDQNFYDYRIGDKNLIERLQLGGTLNSGEPIEYASGLIVGRYKGLKIVEHSGGDAGYRSHLMRFPAQHLSVACLCNVGSASPGGLARRVADIYLADKLSPETSTTTSDAPVVTLTTEQLAKYAGAYWNSWTESPGRVWVFDGRLHVAAPGATGGPVTPLTETRFRLAGAGAEVEFSRSSAGLPRFLIKAGERKSAFFEAVPPADTDPNRLTEFVGNYFSDEIDATYRIERREQRLVILRRKFEPLTLQPIFKDGFASNSILGTVRFKRDVRGTVNGLILSAGRIMNFRMVRQQP